MLKRIFAFTLAVVLFSMAGPIQVCAMEVVNEEPIIINEEVHNEIEQLMEIRSELCMDYEANKELIEKINIRLQDLGVERLSWEEFEQKLVDSDVSPMMIPTPKSGVVIESERFITAWHGERYEIQVVTCSPQQNVSGPLKRTGTLIFESDEKKKADNIAFLQTVVTNAASCVSDYDKTNITNGVLTLITAYDIYSCFVEAMSPTTYINGVDASAYLHVNFYERYVFVKLEGALDEGNQILAYCGNKAIYTATISFPTDIIIEGEAIPDVGTVKVTESFLAQYYDNYTSRVAEIFWNYRRGVTNFSQYFLLGEITFSAIGSPEHGYTVPLVGVVWA